MHFCPRNLIYLGATAVLLSTGCATSDSATGLALPPLSSSPDADILAVGDVLEIGVFRQNELKGLFPVSSQGKIDFPLVGELDAAGKTIQEVQLDLEVRLAEGFLKNPQVTILVKERNALKVYVAGQVQRPGTLAYSTGMNLVEAITKSGGFSRLASRNSVRVTRRQGTEERVFEVPAGKIEEGREPNFELQPGDIVFVPEAIF